MYSVKFITNEQHEIVEEFTEFDQAQMYWDLNADADNLVFGQMVDENNNEIIWEFES